MVQQMELFAKTGKKPSQTQLILGHLVTRGSISALEAMSLYRIFRLAARVEELRNQGYEIDTEMKTDLTGKRYARYVLG